MFQEAEEAANHTAEHRIRHPPTTSRPPARSPCPPIPTLPRTPIQSKFKGLMLPRHEVITHPAGPDLLRYATDGCPVDCGKSWSRQRIKAAIAKGAHGGVEAPGAADACRAEALKRVAAGSCRLINWVNIRNDIPPNLKVSPIAAVPHKSRLYRMILDLSYQIKINGKKLQSVNDTSDKSLAPQHAMYELGNVIHDSFGQCQCPTTTSPRSCSPKSTSKTVTGECASMPMMHGSLLTSSQVDNPGTPFNWSSPKPSRWAGENLRLFLRNNGNSSRYCTGKFRQQQRHGTPTYGGHHDGYRLDHGAPTGKTPILGK
jgi:hypothetical protein